MGGIDAYVGSPTIPGQRDPLTAVSFFGDSFTAGGTNGDPLSVRFASQTCALLGVTENNHGIGGARQGLFVNSGVGDDILLQVYQNIAPPSSTPYAPVVQAAVISCSINNLTEQAYVDDLSIGITMVRRGIERIRAAGGYEALDAGWTFPAGTWEQIPATDANTGTGVMRAESNGATWQFVVPADFPGGVLRVYGPKIAGFGAIESITVDGGSPTSVDNTDATVTQGSQPWSFDATLSSGAHTIAGAISSLNTVEEVNGADFEISQVPVVCVLNTAHSPNYPGGAHTITDQNVTDQNTQLANMLSNVYGADPNVIPVDMDAILGDDPANFGADGIHPNQTGAGLIAAALADAISARF